MKKILLIALLALSANTFAQTEEHGYRIISTISAGDGHTATQYLYITAPKIIKSNVNRIAGGININGTSYDQGDMVLIQTVDGKIIHHQIVGGARTDNAVLDARFDWIMQKGIRRLPGFNYADNKNEVTL